MTAFEIMYGDITTLAVDAIVNAADRLLLGGGGVDGAIHRAAGPELLKFCRKLNGCKPGEAKLSPGFKLQAKFVIHTVGPIWHGGMNHEPEILANCYRNSLRIAKENQFQTVAFPALATGIYRFPAEQATQIAIETCRAEVKDMDQLQRIIFVCFDHRMDAVYRKAFSDDGADT